MPPKYPQHDSNLVEAFTPNQDLENHLLNLYWANVESLATLPYNASTPESFLANRNQLLGKQQLITDLLDKFNPPEPTKGS